MVVRQFVTRNVIKSVDSVILIPMQKNFECLLCAIFVLYNVVAIGTCGYEALKM